MDFFRKSIFSFDFFISFLYKSNIPYVREVSRSGDGITGAYGEPATLMEGG